MSYLTCFYVSFGLYVILLLLSLVRERLFRSFYRIALIPPLFFNGVAFVTMLVQSGHLPSHFLFERMVQLGLWVGILLWFVSFRGDVRRIAPYVLSMIAALFAVSLFFPKELSPLIHRYSLVMAKLFFELEALSFVFFVFSSAYYLAYLVEGRGLAAGRGDLQNGRWYLLVGFTIFLASQFFGSIWSLQGWGDYWMWGKMSALGVVVWFYVMFVIHTRYVPACGRTFEAGVGFLLFVLIISYRMAWQP